MKKFFGINENHYVFEWTDITTLGTILNVALVLCGYWWAPIIGIGNAILNIILCIKNHSHINLYVMNMALIILNGYFLTL